MAKITYIEWNGTEHQIEVAEGDTVMEGAIDNDIPGIEAICGGCCSCSTCHVYVDEAWIGKLPEAEEEERDVLEGAPETRGNSRLSCQIEVGEHLDGLVVRMPEEQAV